MCVCAFFVWFGLVFVLRQGVFAEFGTYQFGWTYLQEAQGMLLLLSLPPAVAGVTTA